MSVIRLERLKQIISKLKRMNCGLNQEYVASAISKDWSDEIMDHPSDDDYFHPGWASVYYFKKDQDFKIIYLTEASRGPNLSDGTVSMTADHIINLIDLNLKECGYVTLDLDIHFKDDSGLVTEKSMYEHALMIIQTDAGMKIVDSYVDVRTAEIRDYQPELLKVLLETPSTETWNTFCQSLESSNYTTKHFPVFNVGISAINGKFKNI